MLKLLGTATIALFLSAGILGYTQEHPTSFLKGHELSFNIFKTSNQNLSVNKAFESSGRFKTPSVFNEKTHPQSTYWIRLDFEGELDQIKKDSLWYLKFTAFDFASLFYKEEGAILEKPVGKYNKNTQGEKVKSNKYFLETSFRPDNLIEGRYLYLKVNRVLFFEQISNWKFTYSQNPRKNLYTWSEFQVFLPIYIFFGVCGIMSILILLFYIYLKRLEFLFNAIYLFALMIYLSKDELLMFSNFYFENELLKDWMLENLVVVIGVSYMLFLVYYLNTKRDYFLVYKICKISILIHFILLVADFFFYQYDFFIGRIYFLKIVPIIDSVTAALIIGYLILNNKNRITTLFIIGSSIFMIGVGSYFYLNNDSDPLRYYNKFYMILSSTIEIAIFTVGLTYKYFMEIVDKLNYQKEAIENKTKALRAQINPHFIFNALSSIQHFVTSNNRISALKYLSKFSRLTRGVLESSIGANVSLSEEIKMLMDYLELESLRFDNSFSYEIRTDTNVDLSNTTIPFMIIQPFVENSIIHGLLPKKEGDKKLMVNFRKSEDFVICEVYDTGVGRNVTTDRSSPYKREKLSRGLEVTKARLDVLGSTEDSLQIVDRFHEDGKPSGTTVIIKIPA